jgi:pyruvate formate-lyase activating enzyme-like uncharacterized protein
MEQIRDLEGEVEELSQRGKNMTHFALTGGEPLIHPEESLRFFRKVRACYPETYTRLYTAGDLVTAELLKQLQAVRLDEIRFSIKLDDTKELQSQTLANIGLARNYVPQVMVEMPVIPGTEVEMRTILLELDRLGAFGINLLEFCFPRNNWEEFNHRGFKIKNPPFPVLYNYGYAGGLPVAGSEELALDLIEFALDEKLDLGVHYCSLENKHRDKTHRQNMPFAKKLPFHELDPEDFFLKTIVVFGDDAATVSAAAGRAGASLPKPSQAKRKKKRGKAKQSAPVRTPIPYEFDPDDNSLQFHPQYLPKLHHLDVQFYRSYNVVEYKGSDSFVRELKLEPIEN